MFNLGNKNKFYFLTFIIAIIFIFLHYAKILWPLENFLISLNKNFALQINNLKKSSFLCGQKQTADENICANDDSLKNQIKILLEENKQLREELNFKQKSSLKTVGAEIIGKNFDIDQHTLLINRGEDDGLKINQPVITKSGYLIGKISKVEKTTASILLINDNNSKIAGETINKDKSIGVIEGGYGLGVKMNLIPRNEVVSVGDTVITSGLESDMPYGILIGKIAAVENEAYKPFQQAIVTPFADLIKIQLVNIVISF